MSPTPDFGFEQLLTEIIRGVVETVGVRVGDTEAERISRQQATVFSVMAFRPRDGVQAMLAAQCVMFNHLLMDATRDLARAQTDAMKLRLRPQLVAVGNMFLRNMAMLIRLQKRPVDQATATARTDAASAGSRPVKDPAPASPPERPIAASRSHQRAKVARPLPHVVSDQDARLARLAAMLPGFAPMQPSRSPKDQLCAAAMTAARGPMAANAITGNHSASRPYPD